MKLIVVYEVQVLAYVDTETEEVTQVVVDDENVRLANPRRVEDDHGDAVADEGMADNAIQIAERADWPGWEFGF